MSDVIEMCPRVPPSGPKQPKSKFGDDDCLLKWCAEWRAARAQQQKNWAEYELATLWGTLDDMDIKLDTEPLSRMHKLESLLAGEIGRPHTVLAARELLGMVVTILAHEDPKGTLAQGPLLEIVRNVVGELDYLKAEMRLRNKNQVDDD